MDSDSFPFIKQHTEFGPLFYTSPLVPASCCFQANPAAQVKSPFPASSGVRQNQGEFFHIDGGRWLVKYPSLTHLTFLLVGCRVWLVTPDAYSGTLYLLPAPGFFFRK